MSDSPDTIPFAEYEAVRQLHQTAVVRARNAEQRERELLEIHTEDQKELDRLKREVSKLKTREENLNRELHRWQTGTEIESDHIPHWVTRSEFEEVAKRRDELARKLTQSQLRCDDLLMKASEAVLKASRLKEERDRLRKLLTEAGAKGANYKLKVEIEQLEQRVKALEGKRADDVE